MRIGIDASNLRAGGGVTHLQELLLAARPGEDGFESVVVWGGRGTLERLPERPWLRQVREPLLEKTLPARLHWQRFRLGSLARAARCEVLFVPGGVYRGSFRPFVTMSRNMLPFEPREARRYGLSWMRLKLLLLRRAQARSFAAADGLIFLTAYARDAVARAVTPLKAPAALIPHGVSERFQSEPRPQRSPDQTNSDDPLRILYVSTIDVYKHHGSVVEAMAHLSRAGYAVQLDLLGAPYPPSMRALQAAIRDHDPVGKVVRYHGAVAYGDLPAWYRQAEIFVFASSCENLPNTLLEAMAAGLPIVCSDRGPMPEVLGDAGMHMDPEKPAEIAAAVKRLYDSPSLRARYALAAHARALVYTWDRCARDTFAFIAQVAGRRWFHPGVADTVGK